MKPLGAKERVRAGKHFLKDPYWVKVLKPAMEVYIASERGKLETCNTDELIEIQAEIRALKTYLALPQKLLDKAEDDLLIEEKEIAAEHPEGQ